MMATDQIKEKAAALLGAIVRPLANSLERVQLNLAGIDADTITAAIKMLGRMDCTEWESRAGDMIQLELKKQLAMHLAKTANYFSLNVNENENGSWSVDLCTYGEKVQHRTFKTSAEARAAGDVLCEFLRLRCECDYEYQVPASDVRRDELDIPF